MLPPPEPAEVSIVPLTVKLREASTVMSPPQLCAPPPRAATVAAASMTTLP